MLRGVTALTTHQVEFELATTGHGHMQDLTERIAAIVAQSGVAVGTAHVFQVGSTGVVGTIEFEPGLQRDLPELLESVIGHDALLALCRFYGGTPLYVPQQVPQGHNLPLVIGCGAAKALADVFGGERIDVPAMVAHTTHAQIRRLRTEGVTTVELARRFGYSVRQVRRIVNG